MVRGSTVKWGHTMTCNLELNKCSVIHANKNVDQGKYIMKVILNCLWITNLFIVNLFKQTYSMQFSPKEKELMDKTCTVYTLTSKYHLVTLFPIDK